MSSATCQTYDDIVRPNVSTLPSISEMEVTTAAVMYAIGMTFMIIGMTVFALVKNRFARTKVRVGIFTLSYFGACTFFMSGWLLPIAIGIENFPCWLSFGFCVMSIGYFFAVHLTRNSTFMLMTALSFATQRNGRIPLEKLAEVEERQAKLSFTSRFCEELDLLMFALRFIFRSNAVRSDKTFEEHLRILVALRYVTSYRGSILFTLVWLEPYFILFIAVVASTPTLRDGCTGCIPDNNLTVYTTLGAAALLAPSAIVFDFQCRNLPDVWGVFKEESLSTVFIGLSLLPFLLISFDREIPNRYMLNILWAPMHMGGFFSVTGLQLLMGSRGNRIHAAARRTSKKVGGQGESASGNNNASSGPPSSLVQEQNMVSDVRNECPKLNEILSKTKLAKQFEAQCLAEFCDENLSFLQNTFEWKTTFPDIARNASAARARKIINTFIRDGGLQQINLPFKIASRLTEWATSSSASTAADSGLADANLFNDARKEVAYLLELGAVKRFMASPAYREVLSGDAVVSAIGGEA